MCSSVHAGRHQNPFLSTQWLLACNSPKHLPQAPPGKPRDVLYLEYKSLFGDTKDQSACLGDAKCFVRDTKNVLLTSSEVKWVSTIVKIDLDILEGQKRQGWGCFGRRPKSSRKSSSSRNKATTEAAQTTFWKVKSGKGVFFNGRRPKGSRRSSTSSKSGSKSKTNNRKSSTKKQKQHTEKAKQQKSKRKSRNNKSCTSSSKLCKQEDM